MIWLIKKGHASVKHLSRPPSLQLWVWDKLYGEKTVNNGVYRYKFPYVCPLRELVSDWEVTPGTVPRSTRPNYRTAIYTHKTKENYKKNEWMNKKPQYIRRVGVSGARPFKCLRASPFKNPHNVRMASSYVWQHRSLQLSAGWEWKCANPYEMPPSYYGRRFIRIRSFHFVWSLQLWSS